MSMDVKMDGIVKMVEYVLSTSPISSMNKDTLDSRMARLHLGHQDGRVAGQSGQGGSVGENGRPEENGGQESGPLDCKAKKAADGSTKDGRNAVGSDGAKSDQISTSNGVGGQNGLSSVDDINCDNKSRDGFSRTIGRSHSEEDLNNLKAQSSGVSDHGQLRSMADHQLRALGKMSDGASSGGGGLGHGHSLPIPISGSGNSMSSTGGVGPGSGGTSGFEFEPNLGMDPSLFSSEQYAHLMQTIESPDMGSGHFGAGGPNSGLDWYQHQQQRNGSSGQGQGGGNQMMQGGPMGPPSFGNHSQGIPSQGMPSQGMPSQGMAPPPHTNGPPNGSFPQNPYYTDPFAAQLGHMFPAGPPPAMMPPQYYGVPWMGYPPGMMGPNGMGQGSGQGGPPMGPSGGMPGQMMMGASGRSGPSGRPLSPNSSDANSGQLPPSPGQYPMMAPPHPYFDTQSMMAARAAAAGMNPMARMMPQMMMNPNGSRGGMMSNANGGLNGMGPAPNGGQPFGNGNGYPTPNNGMGGPFNGNNGMANGAFGGHMNGQGPYSNGGPPNQLGPIGPGGMSGTGLGSPRRNSFDGRRDSLSGMFGSSFDQFTRIGGSKSSNNGFYGSSFGQGSFGHGSPGPIGMGIPPQSMSPTLNGLGNGLTGSNGLGNGLGNGLNDRSPAPGPENKYGAGMKVNGGFGTSNNFTGFGTGGNFGGFSPNSGMSMSNSNFGMSNSSGFGLHSNGHSSNRMSNNNHHNRHSSIDKSTGRSRLLEDFRNNRYPNLSLRDLTDHIVEFSQDQHGSRFIQQKLERASPAEKQIVFNEIISNAYNLMTDVFGNYVIQKFFEFGNNEQKQALAQKVKGNVLQLALQMYGCRVIQKALESIPSDQQKEIVRELDGNIIRCVKDQNGNHVVQKCIECVEPHALQFIINSLNGQVRDYSLSLFFFFSLSLSLLSLPTDHSLSFELH